MSLIHKFPDIILPIQNNFDKNKLKVFFKNYIEDSNIHSSELLWYKYNFEDINQKSHYEELLFECFDKYILKIKSKIKIKKLELVEFLDIIKNLIFKVHKIEKLLNKPNTEKLYNNTFNKKVNNKISTNKPKFFSCLGPPKLMKKLNDSEYNPFDDSKLSEKDLEWYENYKNKKLLHFSGRFYNTILFSFFIEETWIDELVEKTLCKDAYLVLNVLQLYFNFFSNIIHTLNNDETLQIVNVWLQHFMTKLFTYKKNLKEFQKTNSKNVNNFIKIQELKYNINSLIFLKKIFNINYKDDIFKDIKNILIELHNEIMSNDSNIIYNYFKNLGNKLKYIVSDTDFDNFLIKVSLSDNSNVINKIKIYQLLYDMFKYKKTTICSSLKNYFDTLDFNKKEIKTCIYDYTIYSIKNKISSSYIFYNLIFNNEEFSEFFIEKLKFDLLYNQEEFNFKNNSFENFVSGFTDKILKDKINTIFLNIKNKQSKDKNNCFFLTQNYWHDYINTGYIKHTDEIFSDLGNLNINLTNWNDYINYFHPHVGNVNINLKFKNRIIKVEMLPAHYFLMNGKKIFENYDTKFEETIKNNLIKSGIWDVTCKLNTDETLFKSDKIDLIKMFKIEYFKEDIVEKIVNRNILFTKEQVLMANISNLLKVNKLNYDSIYTNLHSIILAEKF